MALTKDDTTALLEAARLGVLKSLGGKRFAITGKLSLTRIDMATVILACHGAFDEKVYRWTDYLIVGQQAFEGRWTKKMEDAQVAGIKVIAEDDFVKMIMPDVEL